MRSSLTAATYCMMTSRSSGDSVRIKEWLVYRRCSFLSHRFPDSSITSLPSLHPTRFLTCLSHVLVINPTHLPLVDRPISHSQPYPSNAPCTDSVSTHPPRKYADVLSLIRPILKKETHPSVRVPAPPFSPRVGSPLLNSAWWSALWTFCDGLRNCIGWRLGAFSPIVLRPSKACADKRTGIFESQVVLAMLVRSPGFRDAAPVV
jgi:hypothetical protein